MNYKLFLIIFFFSFKLYSATILIVTDAADKRKAKEIETLIMNTPPFSKMENLSVVVEKTDSLSCRSNGNTVDDRDISCSRGIVTDLSTQLRHLAGLKSADRVILVSEKDIWAGSGGSYTVTVASGMPANAALHELLHSFNFADEYPYAAGDEADTYCGGLLGTGLGAIETSPNLAVFNDEPPYQSEGNARIKHSSQIPWFNRIKYVTKITTGSQLGTSETGVVGLYKGDTCENYQGGRKKTWKPGNKDTIMKSLDNTNIPEGSWDDIAKSLGTTLKKQSVSIESESNTKNFRGVK